MANVLDNQAAWIVASRTSPLRVSHAPYNTPGPDEIVIRSSAVAINPVDWKQQDLDILIPSYPSIFGSDVAGIVEEVGSSVSRFKKGDRVISNAVCLIKGKDYAAFQLYVKAPANIACILPESMTPEQGCVIPLSVNTAADGLFSKDKMGLPLPAVAPEPINKAVFIYGGSTSVGSSAIQLAKAAGVYVVTTASKRNHEHCRALGANGVFDYNDSDWVDQVGNDLAGRPVLGAFDTVAHGETTKMCAHLLLQLMSDAPITTTNPPPNGIKASTVFGANLTLDKPLAKAIWADYLEAALAQGKFSAQPKPQIVGHGLDKIQEGINMQRKGVSAVKLVVKLD